MWLNGPGDADRNNNFNQDDIIAMLLDPHFDLGPPADWSDGDFDDNDEFNQVDLDLSLEPGHYLQGPFDEAPVDVAATDEAMADLG